MARWKRLDTINRLDLKILYFSLFASCIYLKVSKYFATIGILKKTAFQGLGRPQKWIIPITTPSKLITDLGYDLSLHLRAFNSEIEISGV